MSNCIVKTRTTKLESKLYNDIKSIVKEKGMTAEEIDEAALVEYRFLTTQTVAGLPSPMVELFGNYKKAWDNQYESAKYKNFIDRVDDHGEPRLFYNTDLNRHYFRSFDNEVVLFPFVNSKVGLHKIFDTSEVKSFAKTMALEFYETNAKFDFDSFAVSNTTPKVIREQIKEYIARVIHNLNETGDFMDAQNARRLVMTEDRIEDWVQEVKNFYSTIQIQLQEDVVLADQELATRGSLVRVASYLKSSKNNINNNIRLYLSSFRQVDEAKRNIFGELEYVPFDDIFSTLNRALSNTVAVESENGSIEDEFELYLETIEKLAKLKPYLTVLADDMRARSKKTDSASESFKNQFAAAFRLHKNNFLGSEAIQVVDPDTGKSTVRYIIRNLSEVGSRKQNIVLQWFFNFDTLGKTIKPLISEFSKKTTNFGTSDKFGVKTIKSNKAFKEALSTLKSDLEEIGVNVTPKGLELFIRGLDDVKTTNAKLASKIYKTYQGITEALKEAAKTPNENLFQTQSIFKEMADAEAFYMEEGSDASIFSMGKTKWAYSNPSYLSLRIEKWKKDPNLLLKHYKSNLFHTNSHYIHYLLDLNSEGEIEDMAVAKERLAELELFIFNSIQTEGRATDAVDNKNASATDSMVDYVNKLLGVKSYQKTALAADNSTEYQIKYGIPLTNSDVFIENGRVKNVSFSSVDIIYGYLMDEYSRALQVAKDIEEGNVPLLPNYHLGNKNGLKLQLFPELMTDEKFGLFNSAGIPIIEFIDDQLAGELKQYIENRIIEGINRTTDTLLENEIFVYNIDDSISTNNIDENIVNQQKYKDYGEHAYLAIAGDLFINSLISQVEYTKLFTGDMAYYKHTVDFQKRAKAPYTDGLYMRALEGEEFFNTSIIESVIIDEPSLDALKKYLPKSVWSNYAVKIDPETGEKTGGVNSTDAQAWITPERWEFIMRKLGKWSDLHTSIFKKMNNEVPNYTNKELKILAQPLKGVHFELTEEGRPVYLKYSQAVLIPNLVRNTALETLVKKMRTDENGKILPYADQIHEVITQDGIKVGAPQAERTHDDAGNFTSDYNLHNSKLVLRNDAWKLQQDLPVKGWKQIPIGTQIMKNIFQGLMFNKKNEFTINKQKMTGADLIHHLYDVTKGLSNKGMMSVKSELGLDDNFKITDEDALYRSIIQQLSARPDTPTNILNALKIHTSPYAIPGGADIFQNTFSSLINNKIIKMKTNGGGFIQMADYGLTRHEASSMKGMIFTPWFANQELDRLYAPTMSVDPDTGLERLNPGGVFISGSLLAKYVPNYREYSAEQLFGDEEGNGGIISKDILTKLIGYRIPNQRLPSNDALQVLGILPEGVADTVVAYAGITTKTGSDFDIDKMYLMLPSYRVVGRDIEAKATEWMNKNKLQYSYVLDAVKKAGHNVEENTDNEIVEKLFRFDVLINDLAVTSYHKDFYETTTLGEVKLEYIAPDYEAPMHELSLQELQNMLIEAYQSVLTSKHNAIDLMTPIDNPDIIERDIVNLTAQDVSGDLRNFSAFSDIQTKAKFRAAGAGLGQAVNYTMDYGRGALANLSLDEFNLDGWGHENKENNTVFDLEDSEELTPAEIKAYIQDFNSRNPKTPITAEIMKNFKSIKTAHALNAFTNAFVDVANNPFIIEGNWVPQTNNLGLMLIRAGVHPWKVNAFLAAPILKQFVEYRDKMESKTNFNTYTNIDTQFLIHKMSQHLRKGKESFTFNETTISGVALFDDFVKESIVSMFQGSTAEDISKFSSDLKEKLETRIQKNFKLFKGLEKRYAGEISRAADYLMEAYIDMSETGSQLKDISFIDIRKADNQGSVGYMSALDKGLLETYKEWTSAAKVLSRNVGASRVDVDGKGKDIASLIIAINKLNSVLDQEGMLNGFESKMYDADGKQTPLATAVNNSLLFSYKIMRANPKYFLQASDNVVATANAISMYIKGETLQDDVLAKKIFSAHYSYLMHGFAPFNLTQTEKESLLDTMPDEFSQMAKEYPDNPLLQELYIKAGKNKKFFVAMPNLKKHLIFQEDLVDGWRDLLEDEPEFAEKLIIYSFVISGFNKTASQFHEFIPFEWLNKKGINTYFKSINFSKIEVDTKFINYFFRNNTGDRTIVKTSFPIQFNTLKGIPRVVAVVGKKIEQKGETAPYLIKIKNTPLDPSLSTTFHYYRLVGLENYETPIYTRTTALGNRDGKGNNITEFPLSHTGNPDSYISFFQQNRIGTSEANKAIKDKINNREDLLDKQSLVSTASFGEGLMRELNLLIHIYADVNDDLKPCK